MLEEEKTRTKQRLPALYEAIAAFSAVRLISDRAAKTLQDIVPVEGPRPVSEMDDVIKDFEMMEKEISIAKGLLRDLQKDIKKYYS